MPENILKKIIKNKRKKIDILKKSISTNNYYHVTLADYVVNISLLRVVNFLKENNYEVEEIMVNSTILEDLHTRYDKVIRTVPQVIIDDIFIGGYHEVEHLMNGPTSINKV